MQILNQASVNMIALKVISNGVYPGEPKRMEAEYHDNREEVRTLMLRYVTLQHSTDSVLSVLAYLLIEEHDDLAGSLVLVQDRMAHAHN